jgi:hypothetical protein
VLGYGRKLEELKWREEWSPWMTVYDMVENVR